MKQITMALAVLAALPLAAAADVTKEDIRKLVGAGISDDVILSYIRSNGPVSKLSADDVVDLKQMGASDQIVSALMGSAPASPAASPRIVEVEKVVEKPVYVPQTTYVAAPAYYSAPYYGGYYYGGYYPYYRGYSNCYPRYYGYGGYAYPSVGFYYGRGSHHGSRWGFGVRW